MPVEILLVVLEPCGLHIYMLQPVLSQPQQQIGMTVGLAEILDIIILSMLLGFGARPTLRQNLDLQT